jgi:hypothetical protein
VIIDGIKARLSTINGVAVSAGIDIKKNVQPQIVIMPVKVKDTISSGLDASYRQDLTLEIVVVCQISQPDAVQRLLDLIHEVRVALFKNERSITKPSWLPHVYQMKEIDEIKIYRPDVNETHLVGVLELQVSHNKNF